MNGQISGDSSTSEMLWLTVLESLDGLAFHMAVWNAVTITDLVVLVIGIRTPRAAGLFGQNRGSLCGISPGFHQMEFSLSLSRS